MSADFRREQILERISGQQSPLSASFLAKEFKVSRQVIVGDVALLRARGHDILATAKGYIIPKTKESLQYVGKIVCQHAPKSSKDELYQIVDLGAVVLNVMIEHSLYGEITGGLNLSNRKEVDDFTDKFESSDIKLLSELTLGIHTHTISCRNELHFIEVCRALSEKGYLYE